MPQCLGLTDSDLTNLLAQGWTQVSGPFNSQDECNANCGSSSSSSSSSSSGGSSSASSFSQISGCQNCPNGAPATWKVTFSGVTNGTCTDCVTNVNTTFFLPFVGPSPTCFWQTFFDLCGRPGGADIHLGNNGVNWILTILDPSSHSAWSIAQASFNCLGPNVLTRTTASGACTNWPTTVTVSPA